MVNLNRMVPSWSATAEVALMLMAAMDEHRSPMTTTKKRRRLPAIITATAVCLAACACGSTADLQSGSSSASTSVPSAGSGSKPSETVTATPSSRPTGPPLTHEQLVRELSGLCLTATARAGDGLPRDFSEITADEAQSVLQAWTDELDGVKALNSPPADSDAVERYVRVLQDRIDLMRSLSNSVLQGKKIEDSEASKIGAINRRLVESWAALGVLDCDGQAPPSSFRPNPTTSVR